MTNKKIFSFGVGITILALAFFAGISNAQAADSIIRGNLPNTFSDGVNIYSYNAAQDSGCDGIADGGEVFYGSALWATNTVNLDTTYANTDTDYSITVTEASASGTVLYVYFCNNSNNVIDIYNVADFAISQTRNVSLGKISNGASSAHNDLDSYYVAICTAAGGTQYNNTASQVDAATNKYSQHYAFEQANDSVGDAPPSTITAMFDSAGDNCTYSDVVTTKKTGYVIDVTSASDNYGIVIAFNPDTKVTGDAIAAADLAAAVFTIYNDAGTAETLTDDTSAGMGFEINAGNPDGDGTNNDYIIYYDGAKVTNDIHVKIVTTSNGTTHWLSIDEADFTGAGAYDILVDLNDSGDGVPTDIDDIQVTCNVASSTAPDDSAIFKTVALHNTNKYDIYMPACSSVETVLFKKGGATVFTKTAVDLTASATIDVGKVSGSAHAALKTGDDQVEVFSDNKCTVKVSSETVYASTSATNYEIYFQEAGADYYLRFTEEAGGTDYVSCGNYFTSLDTQATTTNVTVQVSGTRHDDIAAVLVDNDKGGTLSNGDVWTTSFVGNVYHIYTASDTTSQVIFDDTGDTFAAILLTTVTEKNFSTDGVVNVAKVNGTSTNVSADLRGAGAVGTSTLVVYNTADAATALSSRTVDMNTDYNQYFEVPATGAVNIEVKSASTTATLFYVYNKTVATAGTYTFEPNVAVTMTAPAAVLGWAITATSPSFNYRDNTLAQKVIYVDKTEEGTVGANYTYGAYTIAFTTEVLSRGTKDASVNTTFNVNTVTNANIHADLQVNDPITVYTLSTTTANCSGTALSSAITQAWASTSKKYYEKTDDNQIILKVTVSTNVTCVNTLATSTDAGGDNIYNLNIKTSGNVNPDVITVYIDSDQAGGDDISQTAVVGTPSSYRIFWAGSGAADISFYSGVAALLLDRASRDLSVATTTYVAKISGNSTDTIATINVYGNADCSTGGALNSEVVNPGTTYVQYFEGVDGGSYYVKVADATYATCQLSTLTVGSQAATANFDHAISGRVPDISTSTPTDLLSLAITATPNTYWSNVVDNGGTSDYIAYIDGVTSTVILYTNTAGGEGTTLLTLTKNATADNVIANVSAAYGEATTTIVDASDRINAVCVDHSATNTTCATKYSTVAQRATSTAGADYEIFFEQQAATTTYYLEVLDNDAVDYYSWNRFTSGAAGAYTEVQLNGRLSGSVREAFATAIKVPNVTIKMYDFGGDPETNQYSLTYSYDQTGTTTAPTGNYRMYGSSTVAYAAQFLKDAYITQATNTTGALDATVNIDLVSGVKVIVRERINNDLITNATVSIYNCTGATVDTCTATLETCNQPSGNCTRIGDNTAGNGQSGEYYFSGITTGNYIQIKIAKTNYSTIMDPDPVNALNATYQISAATVQPDGLLVGYTYYFVNPSSNGPTLNTPANGFVTTSLTPNLTWANLGGDETDYEVQVDDNADFSSVHAGGGNTATGTATSFTVDTALTTGTKYYWRVRGIDSTGNGAWSAERYFWVNTAWNTIGAPTVATTTGQDQVTITWTAVTGASSYSVYRDINATVTTGDTKVNSGLTSLGTIDTVADGDYYYAITAVDAAGNESAISTQSVKAAVDTTAPVEQSIVINSNALYANSVALTLKIYSTGSDGYSLSCEPGVAWSTNTAYTAGTYTDVAFNLTTVNGTLGCTSADGLKTVYVRFKDSNNNYSTFSDTITLDVTAPTIGTLTAANTAGQRTVSLTWTAATDGTAGIDHYDVYSSTTAGVSKTNNKVCSGVKTLGCYDYPEDGAWYYTVYATDKAGNESLLFTEQTVTVDTTPLDIVSHPASGMYNAATLAAAGGLSIVPSANGTCRWDTADNNYASMPGANEFAVTANTTSTITALATTTTSYTLIEGTNAVFVRCKDSNNNYNLNSTAIMFTYDITGPTYRILSVSSNGNGTKVGGVQYYNAGDIVNVKFRASEALGGALTVTIGGAAMQASSTDGGIFEYVRTLAGTEDTAATIAIGGTTDVALNADVDLSDASLTEFDFITPTVTVTAPGDRNSLSFKATTTAEANSTCRMDEIDLGFDAMNRFGMSEITAGTFEGTYIVTATGTYTIYVVCRDYAGNDGTGNTGAFTVDNTEPSVLTISPTVFSGWQAAATTTVTLTTDVNATCKYATGSANYSSMTNTFTGAGGTTHTANITNIEGTNNYYVLCQNNTNGVTMSNAIPISWKADINNPPVPLRDPSLSGVKYLANSWLMWTTVNDGSGSGINYYTLQIASSTNFASPEVTATTTGFAYVLTAGDKTALSGGINSWRVQAVDNAGRVSGYQGADQTFVLDKTNPTIDAYYPNNNATGTNAWPDIIFYFVEKMDTSSFTAANVKLYKTSDLDTPVNAYVYGDAFIDNGIEETRLIIVPTSTLAYATSYTVVIPAGTLKDLAGNSFAGLATSTYVFTTAAESYGSLTVNNIVSVRSWGAIGGDWNNGWEWVMRITVPSNDHEFAMRFSNWYSGSNSITVSSSTMRYWSEQITGAATGSVSNPVYVTAANTYPALVNLTSDDCTGDCHDDGYQTNVHIQVKIPGTAVVGSYSANYGVAINPL